MPNVKRHQVEWTAGDGALRAFEPTPRELEGVAEQLAVYYNEPHNSTMMDHSGPMSPADVIEHFAEMQAAGDRPFLLERDGVLMGDADLRHIKAGRAEFAIMIGQRGLQGKGLGTRFALMLHALAFEALGLERVFVAIIPANAASQGLFRKLGHETDMSPAARAYIDEEDDVTMSMGKEAFRRAHANVVSEVRWSERAKALAPSV